MIIGFDAKRIVRNGTGLGSYGRNLVNDLSEIVADDTRLRLYAPDAGNEQLRSQVRLTDHVRFVYPERALVKSLWRSHGIVGDLRRDGVDVYHGLSGELPVGIRQSGIRSVVTIHDLIFLRHPEYYKWIDTRIYAWKFRQTIREADRIVAISECTKRDIVELYHIPEEKIEVVYQSINPVFYVPIAKAETDAALQKYGIDGNYVLSVGTIERRKNQEQLVCAADRLPQGVKVVILGKRTPYQDCLEQMVREKHLENRVRILNGVDNHDLCCFYQRASVAVYTSLYEGFGLPVVEALASGCPVIAAKGSCLEEAGGEHTLYIDPQNAEELADAITQIVSDKELQHTMRQQGLAYAQRFRDEAMAAELNRIYQEVTA